MMIQKPILVVSFHINTLTDEKFYDTKDIYLKEDKIPSHDIVKRYLAFILGKDNEESIIIDSSKKAYVEMTPEKYRKMEMTESLL